MRSSKNDNVCLCLTLVIMSHPLSYGAGFRCLYVGIQSHSFAFCLKDIGKSDKSCFEQVVPGDVHCCVVICYLLHCMPSKFQSLCAMWPHITSLLQLLLVTMRRQEHCLCARLRSFLCSFQRLCFLFSAAVSIFVSFTQCA